MRPRTGLVGHRSSNATHVHSRKVRDRAPSTETRARGLRARAQAKETELAQMRGELRECRSALSAQMVTALRPPALWAGGPPAKALV